MKIIAIPYIEKFDLLVALYIFCIAVSELMGAKTFPIATFGSLHLNASVAIFVVPIIFTINDIIVEVFGAKRARSVVWSGFIVIFLFFCYSLIATALPPSSRYKITEPAYELIFRQSARIALASLTAFFVSDLLDIIVFTKLREKLGKKVLWLRTNASNIIAELLDTIIFITLAFYAFNKPFGGNITFLTSLIIPYWLLKCGMSILETPFVYLGVRWLKGGSTK